MTLDDLRALEAAATPGPWTRDEVSLDVFAPGGASPLRTFRGSMVGQVTVNLDMVCAARNALPALLAIAEASREVAELHSTGGDPDDWRQVIGDLVSALATLEDR